MSVPWILYDQFEYKKDKKLLDMDGDTFKMAIFLSTSNCGNATLATQTYSNLTNEHANANGYTTGGVTLTTALALASSVVTFSHDPAVWTASGGAITGRFAVIYHSASGALVGYLLLDATPADVSAANGNDFKVSSDYVYQK